MAKYLYVYDNNEKNNKEEESKPFVQVSLYEMVRNMRNELLKKTDYLATYDYWISLSEEEQNKWASYRQALRDVPEQEGFPEEVIWPIDPSTVDDTEIEE